MQDALPHYIPIKTHKSLPSLTAGMMKTLVWSKDKDSPFENLPFEVKLRNQTKISIFFHTTCHNIA